MPALPGFCLTASGKPFNRHDKNKDNITMKPRTAFQTRLDDDAYQDEILQHVSRTFALTIPELPAPLCRVVGNAYLLCRIADTIEDDKTLPAEAKRDYAERFVKVVEGELDPDRFSADLFPRLSAAASKAEHDLIANIAAVIRITRGFNPRQQAALARCVSIMTAGMAHYQEAETLDGVADLEDLGRYCYHVAGVVGEMLTELFCDYSPALDQHRTTLMQLGVSFGQGLQMTNILKDIWEDHERGACWLPRDVFNKHRVDITKKIPGQNAPGFEAALTELLGIAHRHIDNALRYSLMIPPEEKGLRRFCLWAAGMAVMTLDKIRQNPNFSRGRQVKISRRSVRLIVVLTGLLAGRDRMLHYLFRFLGRHLPMAAIRETLRENSALASSQGATGKLSQ